MPDETATREEKWRLFVAVRLPEHVQASVARAQAQLRQAAHGSTIRWPRPEHLHITFRFLGFVLAEQVQALTSSLAVACTGFPGFSAAVGGIGFFPNDKRPRVIWCGVTDGAGPMQQLHAAVQEATNPFTTEAAEPHFTPHVTLGRVKAIRPAEIQALRSQAAKIEGLGAWQVTHLDLVRSKVSSSGAEYQTVCNFPF